MRDLLLRVPVVARQTLANVFTAMLGFGQGYLLGGAFGFPIGLALAFVIGLPLGYVGGLLGSRRARMEAKSDAA